MTDKPEHLLTKKTTLALMALAAQVEAEGNPLIAADIRQIVSKQSRDGAADFDRGRAFFKGWPAPAIIEWFEYSAIGKAMLTAVGHKLNEGDERNKKR